LLGIDTETEGTAHLGWFTRTGAQLAVCPPGSYTARAVAGEQGERLRSELAERAHRARDEILTAIGKDL
jgi:hypothetical protein